MSPDLAPKSFAYVTTTGRVTGDDHTIEIWFALQGGTIFMLSGGRERSDWVRNLQAEPRARVRIGHQMFEGTARPPTDEEDAWARRTLVEKYQGGYGGDLTNWGRNSLLVAIDVTPGA